MSANRSYKLSRKGNLNMNYFYDELFKKLQRLNQINNSQPQQVFNTFTEDNSFQTKINRYEQGGFAPQNNYDFGGTGGIVPFQNPTPNFINNLITDNQQQGFPSFNMHLPKIDLNRERKSAMSETAVPHMLKEEQKPLPFDDERHKKAQDFQNMYRDLGGKIKNLDELQSYQNGDWSYLEHNLKNPSNYKAVTLKNDKTGEIAVFNMGTDKKSIRDIGADIKMGLGFTPKQFKDAREYHKQLQDQYGNNYKINSIGHSEGGSESQYVGLYNPNIDVYTYNAYGIGRIDDIQKELRNADLSNIYNYRDSKDPVSKLGTNIGRDYVVESEGEQRPFGWSKFHRIENMGDIKNPQSIQKYREQHPDFVSNMDKVLMTSEDVGRMDSDTFRVYEPYLDELLRRQMLMPSYELNRRIRNGMNVRYNNGYYQFI